MGNRKAIPSGTLDDFMKQKGPEADFFLSKTFISDAPSTKKRDRLKRAIVLAVEIEQLRRSFDPADFPLATSRRRSGNRGE